MKCPRRPCLALCLAVLGGLATGAEAAPFVPDLGVRYDGTSFSTSGAAVTSWNNLAPSGSVYDATALNGIAAKRPTFANNVVNNQNVLIFNGTESFATGSALGTTFTPNNQLSIFSVVRGPTQQQSTNTASSVRPIVAFGNELAAALSQTRDFSPTPTGTAIAENALVMSYRGINSSSAAVNNQGLGGGNFRIASALGYTPSAGNSTSTVYRDGVQLATLTNTTSAAVFGPMAIGGTFPANPANLPADDARHFQGEMAEVLVYNRPLNAAEQAIVHNYLSSKYDVALGAGVDRYAGDTPANSQFDFDVFGVGSLTSGVAAGSIAGSATSDKSRGITLGITAGLEHGDFLLGGFQNLNDPNAMQFYLDGTSLDGNETFTLALDRSVAGQVIVSAELLYGANLNSLSGTGIFGTLQGDQVLFELSGALQDGFYGFNVIAPEPSSLVLGSVVILAGIGVAVRRRLKSRR